MKKQLLILTSIWLVNFTYSQSTTYTDLLSKKVKGNFSTYTSKANKVYNIGDTLTLGASSGSENYVFIKQITKGASKFPLPKNSGGKKVVITKIYTFKKSTLTVITSEPEGSDFRLITHDFESSLASNEFETGIMTSDKAIAELKKWKEKLDLELISQKQYEEKKAELGKYIK